MMNRLIISIITFLALNLPLTSYAVTSTFSFSGAFGNAFLTTLNGCQSTFGDLFVSENSSRTRAIKTGVHGASIFYIVNDFCTNQSVEIFGATDIGIDFNFNKKLRTITASGSVPVTVFVFDRTAFELLSVENSVVNFTNLVFTQNSDFVINSRGTNHSDVQFGAFVSKSVSTVDDSFSAATVSGTVSNPLDGTVIDLSTGQMGSSKGHSTSITR